MKKKTRILNRIIVYRRIWSKKNEFGYHGNIPQMFDYRGVSSWSLLAPPLQGSKKPRPQYLSVSVKLFEYPLTPEPQTAARHE